MRLFYESASEKRKNTQNAKDIEDPLASNRKRKTCKACRAQQLHGALKLQHWQARRVHEALGPSVRYLHRLQARMLKVGFIQDDLLYQLVSQAYDTILALSVQLHYLSCKSGVGRPSSE